MQADVWRAFQRLHALRSAAPPLVRGTRQGGTRASFAQERLWYLDQANPGGTAYHLPVAFRMEGALDTRALRLALETIEHRHEALRTSFDSSRGLVVQRVRPPGAFRMSSVSLRELEPSQEGFAARLQEALAREAWRPFDLLRDPLFRATLFELRDDDHVLLLNFHHIIYDGWSQDVLFREVSALYDAFRLKRPSPLSELTIQCADHARWQRSWLRGRVLEGLQDHWRKCLSSRLHGPRLRVGRPDAATSHARSRELGVLPLRLPAPLASAVLHMTREAGVTVFMTLLAAFQVLLHRYSGNQPKLFVCSPIANRQRSEVEPLIGYFTNLLVLPTDLRGDPSFHQVLEQARGMVSGALAHQDLPVQLMDGLDLGNEPLSQVLFSYENTPRHPLTLSELRIRPVELSGGTCDFDLFLALHEDGGDIAGTLKYSRHLLDDADAVRLLEDFLAVLSQAMAAPERHASEFLPTCPAGIESPREADVPSRRPAAATADLLGGLRAAGPERRKALLREYLHETLVRVALRGQRPEQPIHSLQELALDSLRLIELTGRIRTELSIDMPVSRFFEATSLEVLADELLARWLRAQVSETRPEATGTGREFVTL
ncbi:hypothetical protein KRR26_00540 [Corallococcus sp. M34]|uniref:condensation domain-containing protein n=1 Tax=Citreicoccus inhibens TaxID=2849499 RepID=UPI001C219173|nr:condensation domain-containing protein [Citreicoccus inhibens]MBU8894065.1 hypothetical protein [Citreicoccus inhibens]